MRINDIVGCMRIRQWTKNVLIFAAPVFSRHIHQTDCLLKSIAAFFLFSLAASAVYIVNDLQDVERDREHPEKKNRPIPSGRVSKTTAGMLFALTFFLSVIPSFFLEMRFGAILSFYIALQILYSLYLKNMVILDVFVISLGFVLRVAAGALVVDVPLSKWILVCTMLLALFLVLSKRRHELMLLDDNAYTHRIILKEYTPYLLDQMIGVVTSATLVAYMIFTLSQETVEKFGNNMVLTVPFVLYGIFRYLYLVHRKNEGGQPEEILLTDLPMQIDIILYGIVAILAIYL